MEASTLFRLCFIALAAGGYAYRQRKPGQFEWLQPTLLTAIGLLTITVPTVTTWGAAALFYPAAMAAIGFVAQAVATDGRLTLMRFINAKRSGADFYVEAALDDTEMLLVCPTNKTAAAYLTGKIVADEAKNFEPLSLGVGYRVDPVDWEPIANKIQDGSRYTIRCAWDSDPIPKTSPTSSTVTRKQKPVIAPPKPTDESKHTDTPGDDLEHDSPSLIQTRPTNEDSGDGGQAS